MSLIPPLSHLDWISVLPLTLSLTGFLAFWFVFHGEGLKARFHRSMPHDPACLWHIFSVKAWGFFTMGVIPAIVMWSVLGWNPADLGLRWPSEHSTAIWKWTLGLGVVVVAVAWLGARKFDPQYPQMQAKEWTMGMMMVNWLGWALYLADMNLCFEVSYCSRSRKPWELGPRLRSTRFCTQPRTFPKVGTRPSVRFLLGFCYVGSLCKRRVCGRQSWYTSLWLGPIQRCASCAILK